LLSKGAKKTNTKIAYIPEVLAAATPNGASSNTKQLLGSTLP
jgi:hypothetical protein